MYLIVYKSCATTVGDYPGANVNYDISKSRDAMKHLRALNAQTVWVYDKDGYWISLPIETLVVVHTDQRCFRMVNQEKDMPKRIKGNENEARLYGQPMWT